MTGLVSTADRSDVLITPLTDRPSVHHLEWQVVNHRGTRRVVFHAKTRIRRGAEMMYDYGEAFTKNCGKKLL